MTTALNPQVDYECVPEYSDGGDGIDAYTRVYTRLAPYIMCPVPRGFVETEKVVVRRPVCLISN